MSISDYFTLYVDNNYPNTHDYKNLPLFTTDTFMSNPATPNYKNSYLILENLRS